jgi:hypothetical protein
LTGIVHGCFADNAPLGASTALTQTSGSGLYTVSKSFSPDAIYTITFASAQPSAAYTVLLDGRTRTGRALALTTELKAATGLALAPGWLDPDTESTSLGICFMVLG